LSQRRVRPVIAATSRQFEAALSGAGVSIAQSGGERKTRRDRDKDKERNRVKQTGPSPSALPENVPGENDPGLERIDNPETGTSGGNPELSPTPKITGILQRPDPIPVTILQRDEQNSVLQNPANSGDAVPNRPAPAAGTPEASSVRGFSRRGRG